MRYHTDRCMGGDMKLANGWKAWPSGCGVGFSFRRDTIRAELERVTNPDTGRVEWRTKVWAMVDAIPSSPMFAFFGEDITAARASVEAYA